VTYCNAGVAMPYRNSSKTNSYGFFEKGYGGRVMTGSRALAIYEI